MASRAALVAAALLALLGLALAAPRATTAASSCARCADGERAADADADADAADPFALDLERFVPKVMRDHASYFPDIATAESALAEYRRFLRLHQVAGPAREHHVAASKLVDLIWHEHVLDTKQYFADSELLFGRYLHHYPCFVGDEREFHHEEDMTKEYEQEFGEPPPSDVWGGTLADDTTGGVATGATAIAGADGSRRSLQAPPPCPPPPPPCPPPPPPQTCAQGSCPSCKTEADCDHCSNRGGCHWDTNFARCDWPIIPPPPCPPPPPPPPPSTPPTIRLRNGLRIPAIACGTGGDNNASAQVTVHAALTAGFRHIDTAHDYGDQAGVGEAIAAWNSAHPPPPAGDGQPVWLTTKVPGCGVPTQGLMPPCYNNTLLAAEEDLSLLGKKKLAFFEPLLCIQRSIC